MDTRNAATSPVNGASDRRLRGVAGFVTFTGALLLASLFITTEALAKPGGGHGTVSAGSRGSSSMGSHSVSSAAPRGSIGMSASGPRGTVVAPPRGSGSSYRPYPGHGGGGYHGGGYHGGGYYGGWPYWSGYWGWGWGWSGWGWWGYPWGYPWGTTVVYLDGQGYRSRLGRFAVIATNVTPDAAEVYLEGKYIGAADDFDGSPDYLYLERGKYHIEFRHPLYQTLAMDLEVKAGQNVEIDKKMDLLPGKGKLDAFDPPSRGTPLGHVFGKGGEPARIAPDDRRDPRSTRSRGIGIDDEEAEEHEADVDVRVAPKRPGDRKSDSPPAAPDSAKKTARIELRVTPEDASVYLDDRFIGTASELAEEATAGTPVTPGKHVITVMRPGFRPRTVEVELKEGSPAKVSVTLEK